MPCDPVREAASAGVGVPLFGRFGEAAGACPHIIMLAGLSTSPSGHQITTAQLLAAVAATRSIVDGYWLNKTDHPSRPVSGGGIEPSCALAVRMVNPDLAAGSRGWRAWP